MAVEQVAMEQWSSKSVVEQSSGGGGPVEQWWWSSRATIGEQWWRVVVEQSSGFGIIVTGDGDGIFERKEKKIKRSSLLSLSYRMTSQDSEPTRCGDLAMPHSDDLVFDVLYDSCFIIYPLRYTRPIFQMRISRNERLSYSQICELLLDNLKLDIWAWFFCMPDCSLEQGLTIVQNDRDVKKMYEMAKLRGILEVFVSLIFLKYSERLYT
ncbi:hypothetical protein Tco_0627368 [Tanacetum coccineum]|uniref:Uncharacterized protein n=1 Tax=Tanacetum coccineum TaxID=301880 RepID=A0ABQ4WMB4_9ASTR